MGKFGWSYPPGCSGTPYDEDHGCELCYRSEDTCICPVCGVCEVQGDPACYDSEGHGLEETPRQVASRLAILEQQRAEAEAEAEGWQHQRDMEEAWQVEQWDIGRGVQGGMR